METAALPGSCLFFRQTINLSFILFQILKCPDITAVFTVTVIFHIVNRGIGITLRAEYELLICTQFPAMYI